MAHMYTLQEIFTVSIEFLCVLLYLFIMHCIDFSKSATMKSQFIAQSWILGCFDVTCFAYIIALRIIRENEVSISWIYPIFIITKIYTEAHQFTIIWINCSRFKILNNATKKSESSDSLSMSQRYVIVLIFLSLSLLGSSYRIVLIFTDGWPDLNYNYDDQTLMFYVRSLTVAELAIPTSLCFLLNIIAYWRLMKNPTVRANPQMKKKNLKMLMYAVLIVVFTLPLTFYQVIKFYATISENDSLSAIITNFQDLCYFPLLFGNPFILLVISDDLRKECYKMARKYLHLRPSESERKNSHMSSAAMFVRPLSSTTDIHFRKPTFIAKLMIQWDQKWR